MTQRHLARGRRRPTWLSTLTVVAALLMAAARVYVGAHFPPDVVAGLAVGAVVTTAVLVAARRPSQQLVARVAVRLDPTPLVWLAHGSDRAPRAARR